ncbi:MAG: cell filamentation protein Fic [Bdellovibrio sp.]|nr:MAG: cell filamentation protein Fic [Bdellovibrio sp.]
MKPPFTLSPHMLRLCTEIARSLGRLEGSHVAKAGPKLRKSNRVIQNHSQIIQNRVRTIQASLAIEGNTLELDKVTAMIEGKRVIGPQREILEVQNAIRAYDQILSYNPHSAKSLREAHGVMMKGLVVDAGKWRSKNVGIFQGEKVAHAAPQAKRVPELMDRLFAFFKAEKESHPLILSAVFHYELEFIHPFSDGNGRIGRLWQTTLLTRFHPLFEFTPIESVIHHRQEAYYKSLGLADKAADASPFIEFSLETILEALEDLGVTIRPEPLTAGHRLEIAGERFQERTFSRKDYLSIFKTISTATASRDLVQGVEDGLLVKTGEKALASYRFK